MFSSHRSPASQEKHRQTNAILPFQTQHDSELTPSASTGKRKRAVPHAPDERRKVSRACDSCKSKKTRCSGTQPCARCVNLSAVCEYRAAYTRGRPPSPITTDTLSLRQQQLTSGPQPQHDGTQSSPSSGRSQTIQGRQASPDTTLTTENASAPSVVRPMSRNSPEVGEIDLEGLYVSSTSGVSLARAQGRLKCDDASSRTQELYLQEGGHSGPLSEGTDGRAAVVLMTFAAATLHLADAAGTNGDNGVTAREISMEFFQAAQHRLSAESGPVRLTSIQARLAQCLYLLGTSRINHCWSLFGTLAHLALALGIHRKRHRPVASGDTRLIDHECRKRVFWSAYTLDRYLSVMLGRPRTFQDEDVDQEFPALVNDAELSNPQMNKCSGQNQCVEIAPVCHAKLARIIGGIQKDVYPIRLLSEDVRIAHATARTQELHAWKSNLPPFLDSSKVDPSILIPIFQRQSTVLKLAYAHALILANRPFLLSNFASLTRRVGARRERFKENIEECVQAALIVVDTVRRSVEQGQMCQAFWFMQYISFCAVVVLYIHTIQQQRSPPLHSRDSNDAAVTNDAMQDQESFEVAQRCQRHIAQATVENALSRRYNIVMEELRLEVLHALDRVNNKPDAPLTTSNTTQPPMAPVYIPNELMTVTQRTPLVAVTCDQGANHCTSEPEDSIITSNYSGIDRSVYGAISGDSTSVTMLSVTDYDLESSPGSLLAEITSWGGFDSLVLDSNGAIEDFGTELWGYATHSGP